MTHRLPVGLKKVNWFDGQQVTKTTMTDEQSRHVNTDSAIIANFIGSGVVRHDSVAPIIFDSQNLNTSQQSLFDGYSFDGINIYTGTPILSDTSKGVQLNVIYTDVQLNGYETSRVSIIGESFDGSLIHDDLIFEENCTQITRGRYTNIKSIMFSNFMGNLYGSRRPALNDAYGYIGKCIIQEAKSMEVSNDTLIAYQNNQPNQFFDKFIPSQASKTINQVLQDNVTSSHSVSELNIGLSSLNQRLLSKSDITSRFGQKFKAVGTNIQKISILLSVEKDLLALPGNEYLWSGQVVLNIHALQAQVSCSVDPTPDNLIDFDPESAILGQLALDSNDMKNQGIVLDGYAQKVDFVFTGTNLSNPSKTPLEKDKYYIVTIGRSGDTSIGNIQLEEAVHSSTYGYMVYFNGSVWTNIYDSDLWYEIHGDFLKISDGIAYQNGVGVEILKLDTNSSGVEIPYIEGIISFYTSSRNTANYTLLEISSEYSDPLQDPRTGNNISSRVKPIPNFSEINSVNLNSLISLDQMPLILAKSEDNNPRENPASISGTSVYAGLVYQNKIDIINPDADLRNNNLLGSLLQPNASTSPKYRIIKQDLVQDLFGDVTGSGEITLADYNDVNSWLPIDLSNTVDQQKIMDGHVKIEKVLRADVNGDGIVDAVDAGLILDFINGTISTFPAGSSFSRMRLMVEDLVADTMIDSDMSAADPTFNTAPYSSTLFNIEYIANWIPDRIEICDMRRLVPTTFSTSPSTSVCNGGSNNFFVPDDLIISGNMLDEYGSSYSVDFEMTHLSLIIPLTDSLGSSTFIDGYLGVNLFDTFVAESSSGQTALGFIALKYSDNTYVQTSDFMNGKIRITASIQSHSNDYPISFGLNIEDIVGLNYDPATSLLNLWMKDLYDDGHGNIPPALNTKILITVFLKKAGFINSPQVINEGKVRTLFNI